MIDFYNKYKSAGTFSQNGEQGVLDECLARIEAEATWSTPFHFGAVEFGGADGSYCANVAHLIYRGWVVVFIESNPELSRQCAERWKEYPGVRSICDSVSTQNINQYVEATTSVLSIDLDGPDYDIFKALHAKPAIVIIEVDSSIPPGDFSRNADGAAGYSLMLQLAIEKSYFLIYHTGNLVLCANEYRHLFPEIIGDGVSNSELYFNRSWMRA